jgi:hypothetical protein
MSDPIKKTVSILIGGDVTTTGRTADFLAKHIECLWGDTRNLVQGHDYAICNLECPLLTKGDPIPKIGPNLRGEPELAALIKTWGFSAVSLANNHIMDFGPPGLESTLRHCESAGLATFGAGHNLSTATKAHRVVLNGKRFSFINAAEEEFCIAGDHYAGASPLRAIAVYRSIIEERSTADFVIVIFHGGNEYYPLPRPGLREMCRFFVDVGADAVVGHHSHVTGGYEVFRGKPIFYSLGNFLFDSEKPRQPGWNEGVLLSLEFTCGEDPKYRVHPCVQGGAAAGVQLQIDARANAVKEEMASLRSIIEDTEALTAHWTRYCAESTGSLMPFLNFSTNRVFKKIFHMVLRYCNPPQLWIRSVLNQTRCESHRERFLTWTTTALLRESAAKENIRHRIEKP